LVAGEWHDMMDDPEDWTPLVILPEARDRTARELLAARALDTKCMHLAVTEARRCVSEDNSAKPRVGAVVAQDAAVIAQAFRGELKPGEHAEYTLLEGKCRDAVLSGSTVYTTLEPCTTRNEPKKPCVERLIARKVGRVVIGMLDPDERVRGRGVLALRKANIRVDLFPPDLMTELEELNREFIDEKEQSDGGLRKESKATIGEISDEAQHAVGKNELVLSAKHLLAIVRRLPDGSEASIQGADSVLRGAVLPSDDDLTHLRRTAARVGASEGEITLASVASVGWMTKHVREVQATSREMGFDYGRISWVQWSVHWMEAERSLTALTAL